MKSTQVKRTIPSIPQLYRNLRRWTEIFSVLSKYGLADWLSRLNIDFIKDQLKASDGAALARLTQAARIRLALTELGPTFIKFGQLLSTRPDLVGVQLATELSKLQADVPADTFEQVKRTIEQDQGKELGQMFGRFEETPIASASIGQVHIASTIDGQEVVVKVQHDGIERSVETDLDILAGLAQLAERIDEFKPYQPRALVAEMARTMPRELDFRKELRSLLQFGATYDGVEKARIPKPVTRLCGKRVLTMERFTGHDIGELVAKKNQTSNGQEYPELEEINLEEIARRGANLYLRMIFDHGFYHADPHPGNIIVLKDGSIGLIDFGMVGRISEALREDIEAMLVAIVHRDVPMLVTLIKRVGSCPIALDEAELSRDVADFVGHYATQSLANFDMSGALTEFITIVKRFEITLPSEAALLIKVLVELEGTGRLLNPKFSLMEIMRPFQRKLVLKRLSPGRQARKMRRFYIQLEQLIDSMPNTVSSILEQISKGKFDVHLDHRRLGPTVNRLVMGLMVSALFLGSSLMLSYKVPPLIFPNNPWFGIHELSILGLSGCIVSIGMGLRLILAIRKSGNLDKKE